MTRHLATLTIPGAVIPKGRPRFGNGRVYTPAETKDYELKIGWVAKAFMKSRRPVTGWLKVAIDLYGDVAHIDSDNAAKSILDGMNKIVYKDDRQVDILTVTRHRDTPDPRAVVVITEL